MFTDTAKRSSALLGLARQALEGAPPGALVEAAVRAIGPFDGPKVARSIGERFASAAREPDVTSDVADDPALEEALSLIRTAARRVATSQASAERYRLMLERASDGIYIVDASGRYVDVNESGAAMLGFTKEELYRLHIYELVDPADPPIDMPAVRGGESIIRCRRVRKKDGTFMLAELSSHMLPDGTLFGISRDVTDRVRTQEKLHQAQRMEAIGRLAGGIAHDFNNLLTIILAAADVVATELPSQEPLGAHVEAMRQAGTRGAALTRQLLALSRHQPSDARALDVDAQLRRMAPILRRLLGEDIEIRVVVNGQLPPVRIDPSQLDQVFLNLAINARDAMPRGGALVFSSDVEEDGRMVLLRVTDDGVGMDEETRARAFEPFFTTKPAGSGTGLGLATVYGIVQHAGGEIDVESAPGRGTTFRIRLPVTEAARESTPPPERRACGARTNALVLVVEDEPSVRRIVRHILEGGGHRVLEASDGAQGLEVAQSSRERIDAVLSDVVMPGMSGPELTSRLRAERPDLPVLLMSGYLGDALARHGVAPDVVILEKPFTPAMLLEAIERALDPSVRSQPISVFSRASDQSPGKTVGG